MGGDAGTASVENPRGCSVTRRSRAALLAIVMLVATAACGGASSATAPASTGTSSNTAVVWTKPTVPDGSSPTLTTMLLGITTYLGDALTGNTASLPGNPQIATWIQNKITMLQNTSLAVDVVAARRWFEGQATSINGRVVPVVLIFPAEAMRAEAADAVHALEPTMPLLERFYNVPFPLSNVRVWYGFVVGNSGGGGVIYSEDRTTYEARTTSTRLPFDAILNHEMGHTYMAHESLNQFLEIYTYNAVRGASTDVTTWGFTRGWTPGASSNTGVAALLDICQLIGFDAMQTAYRAIYPLKPAYGAGLTQNVIDAFVSSVPAAQQSAVRAKLNNVGF